MHVWVGLISELTEDDAALNAVTQLFCSLDSPFHALFSIGKFHLCTIGFHETSTLNAHRFGHREDESVAFHSCHQSQPDTRVATRRLDNRGTRFQFSCLFSLFNHSPCDAIFHTSARIKILNLGYDGCFYTAKLGIFAKLH